MQKKRRFIFSVITIIIVIAGILLILNLSSAAKDKQDCIASSSEIALNLNNLFSQKGIVQNCQTLFESKKNMIVEEICSNSRYLGEVRIMQGSVNIDSFQLDCPESLVGEDVPLTITGEFFIVHGDDFEKGISYDYPKIMDLETGKELNLKVKNKNSEFSNIPSGTIVKVRGIKKGSELFLESDDEKSIIKINT